MKKINVFFLLVSCFFLMRSQDAQFNNIQHSLVYLNPSFAGTEGCVRTQIDYRNQWPNLSGTYIPTFLSVDGFIKPINGGIALNVISENMARGTLRTNGIAISYAQHIKLSNALKLIPSAQFSYKRSLLDRARLNFYDLIDFRYGIFWPPINSTTTDVPVTTIDFVDAAAGIILKHDNGAELGASFSNLLAPNISHFGTYRLPVKTNIHANYKIYYNPRAVVNISFISTFQNNYYNTRINLINKTALGIEFGAGYGINNSLWTYEGSSRSTYNTIRGFIGYNRSRFGIMYSYDQYLMKSAAGSHELSLQILFKKKESIKPSSIEELK